MKIAVLGCGYVGLVSGVCFANLCGHSVVCIDNDEAKVKLLSSGSPHIHETGLQEALKEALKEGSISFTTDKSAIKGADIIAIAVGTPAKVDGSANLSQVYAAVEDIAAYAKPGAAILIKSTVPVGTAELVEDMISKKSEQEFEIISNPEFLREGRALEDFANPDRIVLGFSSTQGKHLAQDLYNIFIERDTNIVYTDNKTAEMIKYASNAYLAMRIAFVNEMADIAAAIDADVEDMVLGMGLDHRIGKHYLRPGPGFGGSCFPKDTAALNTLARACDVEAQLIKATIEANHYHKQRLAGRVVSELDKIDGKKVAVLGLTFKADTDDMRDSPSIDIINELLDQALEICAYDPCGLENAKAIFGDTIAYRETAQKAVANADAILVLTEWEEFTELDPEQLGQLMNQQLVFDYRNVLNIKAFRKAGFKCFNLGS
jgi:UDPglucose 6-dehydrogenase